MHIHDESKFNNIEKLCRNEGEINGAMTLQSLENYGKLNRKIKA